MKKILVPIDGSPESEKLFDYIKNFGEKFGSEIILLNVVENPKHLVYEDYPFVQEENYEEFKVLSGKILEKAKNHLGETTYTVKTVTKLGDPATVIIDFAEEMECDVIILSTHRMTTARRFLIGGVTNKVVHHASVPVLVIR